MMRNMRNFMRQCYERPLKKKESYEELKSIREEEKKSSKAILVDYLKTAKKDYEEKLQGKQENLQAIIDDKDATIRGLQKKIKEGKEPFEKVVQNLGIEVKTLEDRNAALEIELNKARGKIDELTPKKQKWNDTTKKTNNKRGHDDDDEDEGGGKKPMSKSEAKKTKFAKKANKYK